MGDPSIPVRQGGNVVSQQYTVLSGDTLSEIALKFYGDASLFPLLAVVNHIPDPNVIHTGDILLIPDLADTFASNDSSVPAVTARNYADGDGVLGDAIGGGRGLAGHSHTGIGVLGESDTFEGVRGVSCGRMGAISMTRPVIQFANSGGLRVGWVVSKARAARNTRSSA